MNSAIVFSKDRACQLDLLLRSVTCHAPELFDQITVIWTDTGPNYRDGYSVCRDEHDHTLVSWVEEEDFMEQTLETLDLACDHMCFLTDDSVFYRSLEDLTPPETVFKLEEILCFSLRLGLHTGQCYPLSRFQGLPTFETAEDMLVWEWRTGDADFGYMGSLDGHLFRRDDLLDMLDGSQAFRNPNSLEEVLQRETNGSTRSYAACYRESHLVGVPVNRVNDSHPNRYGEHHEHTPEELNEHYLDGKRINLDSIKADRVTAAHAEMELKFDE